METQREYRYATTVTDITTSVLPWQVNGFLMRFLRGKLCHGNKNHYRFVAHGN